MAAEALVLLVDATSVQELYALLEWAEDDLRAVVVRALGRTQSPEAVAPLVELLADPALSSMAARALEQLSVAHPLAALTVLDARLLPRSERGLTGVTDILRLNVGRFLRDMDEPEFALEYVDLGDFSVGHIRGAKRYPVDLVFRFTVMEDGVRHESAQLVRLVLDRNGIQRMQHLARGQEGAEAVGPLPFQPAVWRQGA